MEKVCMFSTVLVWSLAGSVMGCWAMAGGVATIQRIAVSKTHTFQRRECVGHPAPTFLVRGERRPTRRLRRPTHSKTGNVWGTRLSAGAGYPPPPRILVFMKLRTVSAQTIVRMGVIWKVFRNKDLAEDMTA